MTIEPIETKYKGCRFRSRLEARWAVFFDAANIKWQYEPQGYVVKGRKYLPDFFLQELECYFEVKGTYDYDEALLQAFSESMQRPVILAVGDIPDPATVEDSARYKGHKVFLPVVDDEDDSNVVWGYEDMFLGCHACGRVRLINQSYATQKDLCCQGARIAPLAYAFESARSARFEYGESG